MYCDQRILEKILKKLENEEEILKLSEFDRVNYLLNLFSYCNHAGFIDHEILPAKIYFLIKNDLKNLTIYKILLIGNAFSRNKTTPKEF